MIITYRVTSTQWPHNVGQGKVRRHKTFASYDALCPAFQSSECDWMVPTLFPWVEKSDGKAATL